MWTKTDGWVVVPVDATIDMLKEGAKQNMKHESFQSVWKAMLAAGGMMDQLLQYATNRIIEQENLLVDVEEAV